MYSVASRWATISNCSGPTAPSSRAFPTIASNTWIAPSSPNSCRPFCNCFALNGFARARGAKEIRREVRNAPEGECFAVAQRIADLQLSVVVDAGMSPATASSLATRSFAMKVSALASFISRPVRRWRTFIPGW